MARLRLVNLSSLPIVGNRPVYPVGLVSLAQAAREDGHDVEIVDFVERPDAVRDLSWLDEPCDVLGLAVRDVDPIDLARFSFLEAFAAFTGRIRKQTAAAGYRPLRVGGGAGFSLFAEELGALLEVDVVVRGEGEAVLLALCRNQRAEPPWVRTAPDLAFPGRRLQHSASLLGAYRSAGRGEVGVETRRRKCLRKCQYCPYAFINDGALGVFKDIARLREHLEHLYALGVRDVFFTDAVFNNEPQIAKAVCRLLAEGDFPDLRWSAYFVPSQFDEELADLIGASNNRVVIMSPDSFDPRMMRLSGKSFKLRHVFQAKKLCDERGLRSAWTLLFGSAHENRETLIRSARTANELFEADEISINVGIRLLPGSPLARRLHLSPAELLPPVFYPVDPRVFDWIFTNFDPRFLAGGRMLRLTAVQNALGRLQHRPFENPIDPELGHLLVQQRPAPLAAPPYPSTRPSNSAASSS